MDFETRQKQSGGFYARLAFCLEMKRKTPTRSRPACGGLEKSLEHAGSRQSYLAPLFIA